MDAWTFLAAPFVASLILTGIHTYLGVHVVERGVIFVDLSLAQIAALGAAVAILYGTDPHSAATYWISVAFTFVGAAVFANVRSRKARIPQEAIIGICYAVASAATILAMSKARGEIEHLQEMLVGNLLFVSWDQVGKTARSMAPSGCSTTSFARTSGDLDEPRPGERARASRCASGTCCSTPRSASW